jgi:hypothetical protein
LLESGSSLLERAKFKQGSNFKNMLKLFCIGLEGSGLGADQKPEREWRKSPARLVQKWTGVLIQVNEAF